MFFRVIGAITAVLLSPVSASKPIKSVLEILQEVRPEALRHEYVVVSLYKPEDAYSAEADTLMESVEHLYFVENVHSIDSIIKHDEEPKHDIHWTRIDVSRHYFDSEFLGIMLLNFKL